MCHTPQTGLLITLVERKETFDSISHTQDVTRTFDSSSEATKQIHRTLWNHMACINKSFGGERAFSPGYIQWTALCWWFWTGNPVMRWCLQLTPGVRMFSCWQQQLRNRVLVNDFVDTDIDTMYEFANIWGKYCCFLGGNRSLAFFLRVRWEDWYQSHVCVLK